MAYKLIQHSNKGNIYYADDLADLNEELYSLLNDGDRIYVVNSGITYIYGFGEIHEDLPDYEINNGGGSPDDSSLNNPQILYLQEMIENINDDDIQNVFDNIYLFMMNESQAQVKLNWIIYSVDTFVSPVSFTIYNEEYNYETGETDYSVFEEYIQFYWYHVAEDLIIYTTKIVKRIEYDEDDQIVSTPIWQCIANNQQEGFITISGRIS